MSFKFFLLFIVSTIVLVSCADDTPEEVIVKDADCFTFSSDTAYKFVQKQVSMGPRIPGTATQKECADWLESKLEQYTDEVFIQETEVEVGGRTLPCINLVGSIAPEKSNRILLLAHWDTRPWADKEDKSKQLDGADDGASGVAVLLEIARQVHNKLSNIGIDILLVDVEDYGNSDTQDSYCKGSQYWAANPHVPGYKAQYGILLDMVGGKYSKFYQELYSKAYAQSVLNNVWNTAHRLGFGAYFPYTTGMGVTDDHYYINEIAKIPTIDIIGAGDVQDFAPYHHTSEDDMDIISPQTLNVVGQTVLQVLCNENQKAGSDT